MISRNIINNLREWAKEKDRKPLILRGARQVGKTTVVRQFAKDFDQYIELNLEKKEDRQIFDDDYSLPKLLDAIFYLKDANKNLSKTLLFIDEIQNSPKAVSSLRYFYEEAQHLHVIAAGSLLESLIDKKNTFPVGRVDYLPVRPCSFEEYLGAVGEQKSLEMIRNLSVPDFAHDKLTGLFGQYTIVGGLPEILNNYIENRDLFTLKRIYDRLIVSYQDDVEKYADTPLQENAIRHIIGSAFQYTGKRITFERFGGSTYRSRDMGEAFRMLEKTMLLQLSYPVTGVRLPAEEKRKRSPKLILLDTGLVNYSAGIQKELFTSKIIDDVYQGRVAEHITAQQLLAHNLSVRTKLNFWTREERNAQAEVDFVFPFRDMLIPIEVKAGATGSLRSLHQFMNIAPHETAIRVYSGKHKIENARTNTGKKFQLINLPFYLTGQIEPVLIDHLG
jgi:hypothetical protein